MEKLISEIKFNLITNKLYKQYTHLIKSYYDIIEYRF